jgi:hypothetical protein
MAMNLSSCCAEVEVKAKGTISAIPIKNTDIEKGKKILGFRSIIMHLKRLRNTYLKLCKFK